MSVSKKQHEKTYKSLQEQGLTPEFIESQRDYWKNKINSGEAKELLRRWQLNPSQALSAPNITQATAAPTPRPDDLLGIRSGIQSELGIPAMQEDYQKAYEDYNKLQTEMAGQYQAEYGKYLGKQSAMEATNAALEGKPMSMNVIRGMQGQAKMLGSAELSALGRGLEALGLSQKGRLEAAGRGMEALSSKLQASQMEASERFGIRSQEVQEKKSMMMEYPGAGIKWSDNFEAATGKIQGEIKKQADEQAFYETYGVRLSDRPKGTSKRQWKKKWSKKFKKSQKAESDYTNRKRELEIALMEKNLRKTTGGGRGGGYSSQEQRKLRAAGIDPSDVNAADKYLYGEKERGGYTDQEVRKLRAVGINTNNVEMADDYLYGSKLSPAEKDQVREEEEFAKSLSGLREKSAKSKIEEAGYDFDEFTKAYPIEFPKWYQKDYWTNFWK